MTDATNAARSTLYDIRKGRWSSSICELLDIPMKMLPAVKDCTADFGVAWLAGMRAGVYPDQQAFATSWARGTQFTPSMDKDTRDEKYVSWKKAVQATLSC